MPMSGRWQIRPYLLLDRLLRRDIVELFRGGSGYLSGGVKSYEIGAWGDAKCARADMNHEEKKPGYNR